MVSCCFLLYWVSAACFLCCVVLYCVSSSVDIGEGICIDVVIGIGIGIGVILYGFVSPLYCITLHSLIWGCIVLCCIVSCCVVVYWVGIGGDIGVCMCIDIGIGIGICIGRNFHGLVFLM